MSIATAIIKGMNKVFPEIEHPFNMQNSGEKTYAQWEFEMGAKTIACYEGYYTPQEMFGGKNVLDMGCGAGGKSLYYVSLGAAMVTGVEIVDHYKEEAEKLSREMGYEDRFRFVCASALDIPFPDESFDTIIMNDFIEHVSEPAAAIREAMRLLQPGGRIYMNFPPYYHPTGAHMSDVIYMPWVQLFFSEKQLIAAYKDLVKGLPDEKERLALRFSTDENGVERFTYINHMTLKKFKGILAELGLDPVLYREIPLRSYFKGLAKLPLTREMFVKMAVCVVEK